MSYYQIEDLIQLMSHLRSSQYGCPWDRKQTFSSLIPYTLEEAYEVVEAIEGGDLDEIRLELGDLLFQVIFYAQLANEQSAFDFNGVVSGITEKLLRRHPHVFPDSTLASAGIAGDEVDEQQIKQNWEQIKRQEKVGKSESLSILDDVPKAFPAMMRAYKLQKCAARVGFDWPEVSGVLDKVREEITELEEAIETEQIDKMTDELGDLLFSCVNLARHLELDPETALRSTIQKFEKRFRHLELGARKEDKNLSDMSLDEMESAWQKAKKEKG